MLYKIYLPTFYYCYYCCYCYYYYLPYLSVSNNNDDENTLVARHQAIETCKPGQIQTRSQARSQARTRPEPGQIRTSSKPGALYTYFRLHIRSYLPAVVVSHNSRIQGDHQVGIQYRRWICYSVDKILVRGLRGIINTE